MSKENVLQKQSVKEYNDLGYQLKFTIIEVGNDLRLTSVLEYGFDQKKNPARRIGDKKLNRFILG